MIPEEVIQEPISLSLTPYSGTWTKVEAAHLLRRCLFGPTYQQIVQAETNGLAATVAQLLSTFPVAPPLTYSTDEAVAAMGTTWVTTPYPSGNTGLTDNARKSSLAAWMMERLNQPTVSIQEKMCLFWTNHFGANSNADARSVYEMHELYRSSCLGNFKQLVKDMTINANMLIFLNGATNNPFSPNENYARELLELFTVGKGPQVGPGDYTNYTETDIAQSAKILTGYTIQDYYSSTANLPTTIYQQVLHDTSTKQLSGYFGNATIPNADDLEYSNYIDILFQQPNMAKFICGKIYRWFVNYDLTPTVESTVIADMAATLEANNFDILPVMDELLKSEHFYDISVRGAIIKNPLELIFSMYNSTESTPNYPLSVKYDLYYQLYGFSYVLGMDYLNPPNVGGWTAYYQVPSYSKLWANSSLIKLRFDIGIGVSVGPGLNSGSDFYKIDTLQLVSNLSIPDSAPDVINDLVLLYTPKGLSVAEKYTLKMILTNGQADNVWASQYQNYEANPSNPTFSNPVRQRVEFVLYRLFQLPQFQTI